MQKIKPFFLVLFLLAGCLPLLAACDQGKDQNAGGKAGAMGGGMPAMPVTVAQPVKGPVSEYRDFAGWFEAVESVDIRARVSGYLTKTEFTDGTIVHKGDPLFVIDPRPFEAALHQREADRTMAASQVAAAKSDYDRAADLYKTGDVSAALLDQRRAARDSAVAAVAAAQAAVDSAKLDLAYTRITAPIDGRIGRALVTPGNLVAAGQNVLTSIVSIDPIYFYFNIDEPTYLAYARRVADPAQTGGTPKIPVDLGLGDEKDYPYAGAVDFIDNTLAQGTGTMRARAVVPNANGLMTPGMFGRARFRIGGQSDGILIPDDAVVIDQSRKLVYVVGPDNIVAARTIETGPLYHGLRIVTKGLDGSEWIVVNGIQRAHEGAPVAPTRTEIKQDDQPGDMSNLPPPSAAPADNETADKPADSGLPNSGQTDSGQKDKAQ
ncbi:MAG: efflux RND transporter periplasmic adaptor subunit [Rhodospirillales bacterium]|nr:efflux RND transporter periplasmic adaptor subunit [Alphaproteobacteria bacterium]MCB9987649.1 efflux RND transporter periplasmic adaptor subunit [Rhodospirillales bacterium]USO08052.1 MAG: efflux RND transporter periplasmic adaptor subunit [Rhodospirillales bacterium]